MRIIKGIVLGLIVQGVGHLLLVWPLKAHIFPPTAWHVLPFILGGLVCGLYATRAFPGFVIGVPYAAVVVFADGMVDPGVSGVAIAFAVVGLALGTTTCGVVARRRAQTAAPAPEGASPPPPAVM
ncbi:MAG: hypothetical protein JSV65_19665 [Armatimonadota bacterium]|nr:MAG: hypothetical protein JSV65_19665 [Armatimonadota bacterium]